KSGGAQATTHLSSPEHPSESFRREVRVANSVLRANDHRDVYNNNRGCFFTALFFSFVLILMHTALRAKKHAKEKDNERDNKRQKQHRK
ncbi:MAG: hypothetical protein II468_03625, partial [Lachnospiraceae bacterium]|nr:hypothetical protein [Lachnospiraceae bacterium]